MPRPIKIEANELFEKNYEAKAQTVVNVGGARSGKSWSLSQLLISRGMAKRKQGLNIGITRKTMPALKMTAYKLVIDHLKQYGIYKAENHNRVEHYYMLGKTRIQFFSLDDPEKIRSTEFNYIWMEEATEFTYNDYLTLLTRLSAPSYGGKNQIFLTLNPSDEHSWIRKLEAVPNTEFIYSNYKNNPYLSQDYIGTLLSLKDMDYASYQIFTEGKWAAKQGRIYTNYALIDALSANPTETIYGLDFGFNNPAALVKVQLTDSGAEVEELLYESGLTNTQLIERAKELIAPQHRARMIYADAAEPDRIEEFSRAGFNIHSAAKDVEAGILAVKSKQLKITKSSANLIKEIGSYAWKVDKNGNTLEEPVKFNDHALDALRYAIYTYTKTYAGITADSLLAFY